MATSEAAANATLDREVTAGGEWEVTLLLSMPGADLSGPIDEAPVSRATLARTAAAWVPASGRSVRPVADVDLGTAAEDFTPVAWAFLDGGVPAYAGRLVDVTVTAGADIVIPAETLTLNAPADTLSNL